jgi:hypothetical protein
MFIIQTNSTTHLQLIAFGNEEELLDRVYSAFSKYKRRRRLTVVEGPGVMMGDTELDARLALVLETPVLLTLNTSPFMSLNETFNQIMMKRQVFLDHKVNGMLRNNSSSAQRCFQVIQHVIR